MEKENELRKRMNDELTADNGGSMISPSNRVSKWTGRKLASRKKTYFLSLDTAKDGNYDSLVTYHFVRLWLFVLIGTEPK